MEACYGRKWLFAKDALDGGAVFVDLFGLAYELVNGSRVGEDAFGVEPPLLQYHLGESRGSNSAIMSEILKSPILPELLDEMARLVRLTDKRDDIKEAVVAEYGEELVDRALRYCDDFVAPGLDAPEEELREAEAINEAVFESAGVLPEERPRFIEAAAIGKAIDDCYDEENRLVRDESASRYMVQKRFGEIVELIAPSRFTK